MRGLTPTQARTLDAIRRLSRDGCPPSYDEIRLSIGASSRAEVLRLIRQLSDRGAIAYEPRRARSIRIIGEMEGLEQRDSEDLRALRRNIDLILQARAQA